VATFTGIRSNFTSEYAVDISSGLHKEGADEIDKTIKGIWFRCRASPPGVGNLNYPGWGI
jgi:hypothetical protein